MVGGDILGAFCGLRAAGEHHIEYGFLLLYMSCADPTKFFMQNAKGKRVDKIPTRVYNRRRIF